MRHRAKKKMVEYQLRCPSCKATNTGGQTRQWGGKVWAMCCFNCKMSHWVEGRRLQKKMEDK